MPLFETDMKYLPKLIQMRVGIRTRLRDLNLRYVDPIESGQRLSRFVEDEHLNATDESAVSEVMQCLPPASACLDAHCCLFMGSALNGILDVSTYQTPSVERATDLRDACFPRISFLAPVAYGPDIVASLVPTVQHAKRMGP